MKFREADAKDIDGIQIVRRLVKENRLSDPGLVSDQDVSDFISDRGKGWVCEEGDETLGFAIADLMENNIWALFIHPEHEGKGIGKYLHALMLDWYFAQGKDRVWLSTTPGTRAEKFYRKAGWTETGIYGKNEIKFEMTRSEWLTRKPEPAGSE